MLMRPRRSKLRGHCITVVRISLFLGIVVLTRNLSYAGEVIPNQVAKLEFIRINVEANVSEIKKNNKPDSEIYRTSKTLYEGAYSKYKAWQEATGRAIAVGTRNVAKDLKYKHLSEDAIQAVTAFLKYSDEHVSSRVNMAFPQSVLRPGVIDMDTAGALSHLRDWGIELWEMYRMRKWRQRAEAWSMFQGHTSWSEWSSL